MKPIDDSQLDKASSAKSDNAAVTNLGVLAADWLERITYAHDNTPAHEPSWTSTASLNHFVWLLGAFQLFLVILFGTCAGSELLGEGASGTGTQGYNMFIGVEIMMFIGFGYLMTFMKLYGISAVGFTMIVTAVGLQYYVFAESFFTQLYYSSKESWEPADFNIYALLNALYGISTVLISFGALIGKITPVQLLFMTIVELTLHAFNYKVLLTGVLNVSDAGGTYVDHMFGAYFGLTIAYIIGKPNHFPEMGNVPDIFSLLGCLFLWVYWPSFVGGALEADSDQQQRAIVNVILALSSSTVFAFWASSFLSTHARLRPVDIQNATLAGGVAIGCVANIHVAPFGAIMVGAASGLVSAAGYNILQPILEEKFDLHDTCGVHNLHGMPAIVGALASVFLAAYKGGEDHDGEAYGDTAGDEQWWHQFVGMIITLGLAVVSGAITGYCMKFIGTLSEDSTNKVIDKHFHDDVYWEVADDYNRSMYVELMNLVENDPEHGRLSPEKLASLRQHVEDLSGHEGRRHEAGDNALQRGSNHSGHDRHPTYHTLTGSNHDNKA